ncbi:MAG: DNA-directed RNA polymerase subunit D [Nitrososphaerota archaeon]
MVDLKIVEEDEKSLKVEIRDLHLSIANAIRRLAISEVPTMAVEEILIIENTSAMPNEVLAHRISLIPFISDIDRYVQPEECTCGSKLGCDRCVVRYVLRAEAKDEPITVYSRDLIPEDPNTIVKPVSPNIPIIKLAPKQRIEMELYVRVGTGKKHAKWQASIATLYDKDGEPGKKILFIESIGFLPPRRILLEAVKIFKKKVEELKEKIMGELGG